MQEDSPPRPRRIGLRFCVYHNKDDLVKVLVVSALDGLPEISSKYYPVKDGPQTEIVRNSAVQEMEEWFLFGIK